VTLPKEYLRLSKSARRNGLTVEQRDLWFFGYAQHTMDHANYSDDYIRGILNTVKSVAMVGVSANTSRPSYFAFKYLLERGYRMIPVNPGLAGQQLLGQKVYAKLADIPEPIDMVDIFRASRYAPAIVAEALALATRPQVVWMQLGVRCDEAADLAEQNGLKVVMNRCPKIEYGRLSSEIAWMGVNTRTLTARKPKRLDRRIQRMALNRVTVAGGSTDAAMHAQNSEEST
jgi:predicted CoA-binding protein